MMDVMEVINKTRSTTEHYVDSDYPEVYAFKFYKKHAEVFGETSLELTIFDAACGLDEYAMNTEQDIRFVMKVLTDQYIFTANQMIAYVRGWKQSQKRCSAWNDGESQTTQDVFDAALLSIRNA